MKSQDSVYVVIMGPPGAGKGAQSRRLVEQLGFEYISTGDLFRAAITAGTPLGRFAEALLRRGELMPDRVATALIADAIARPGRHRMVLFDGYPRTVAQAASLDKMLTDRHERVHRVIWLSVPSDVLRQRLSGRLIDPTSGRVYHMENDPPPSDLSGVVVRRIDDSSSAAAQRLHDYSVHTAPVFEHYRRQGVAVRVDGSGSFDEVHDRIINVLELRTVSAQS